MDNLSEEHRNELDAAAILLSLKSTPTSFPPKSNKVSEETGYIPLYDWTQAFPCLSYAGNTYNINLQMYNSPIRLIPVPCNPQNGEGMQEMSVAFVKFCQIHRDTLMLQNAGSTPQEVNDKLLKLWIRISDEEKVVYSRVARNELLLMQGKDIASSPPPLKSTPPPSSTHSSSSAVTSKKGTTPQGVPLQAMRGCKPSLFRHEAFAAKPELETSELGCSKDSPKSCPKEAGSRCRDDPSPPPTPDTKPTIEKVRDIEGINGSKPQIRPAKQRSNSLSEKHVQKVLIRRAISQEDVVGPKPGGIAGNSNSGGTGILSSSPKSSPKKFFIRMRRHSMNDGILNAVEKLNPYFTKTYTRTAAAAVVATSPTASTAVTAGRGDAFITPKTPTKSTILLSPKRNLSVTNLEMEYALKSPPKKSRGNNSTSMKSNIDVFDFKSETSHTVKQEPDDGLILDVEGEGKKTDTYCYSLLKGASKTSSVNPSFSSRKTLSKKVSLPVQDRKCAVAAKYDGSFRKPAIPLDQPPSPKFTAFKQPISPIKSPRKTAHITKITAPLALSQVAPLPLAVPFPTSKADTMEPVSPSKSSVNSPGSSGVTMATPTASSPIASSVTMVTTSPADSIKTESTSSTPDSKKSLSLINDSDLISHAIDELEDAEKNRLKVLRRSHASGSFGITDVQHKLVYKLFREHGLEPPQNVINEFYNTHKEIFSSKSAATLTIRQVRQKIIKLQIM